MSTKASRPAMRVIKPCVNVSRRVDEDEWIMGYLDQEQPTPTCFAVYAAQVKEPESQKTT